MKTFLPSTSPKGFFNRSEEVRFGEDDYAAKLPLPLAMFKVSFLKIKSKTYSALQVSK